MSIQNQKRCYYEVLGLPQSCTQDEIRSAYKKLALQRHPDKLVQAGVSADDATAAFQELVHAYEVLSDPKERSWYDSHRSQILFSQSGNSDSDSFSPFPDLFSYFSPSCYTDYTNPKTGFYKVYGDVFDRVYANEVSYCRKMGLNLGLVKEAPLMGDLNSDYAQVNAFYGYWLSFSTVMDFGWVAKWDAAAGVNRKSRRVMEEENKKLRKKAKKEFNETVRGLAEFVKKRDKRVIDMMVRKEKEREKKREEEMAKRKEREREKLERARAYEEPDWARVEEVEEFEELEEEEDKEEKKKELYCVACGKKFKSEKQWKNHEQSKKHKEKVAELRKTFEEEHLEEVEEMGEDEERCEEEGEAQQDVEGNDEYENDIEPDGVASVEDVDELEEKIRDSVRLQEAESRDERNSDEADDDDDNDNAEERGQFGEAVRSDDETSILEAMISGRRNRRNVGLKNQHKSSLEKSPAQSEDETEPMEYNNKKGKKKSKRAKKEKGKNFEAEATRGDDNRTAPAEAENGHERTRTANVGEDYVETNGGTETLHTGKPLERKGASKKDAEPKPKNSSKGRKQKKNVRAA
uniref:J domain-containing protein n=1 Tax=Opuntia streptacantha TaxID=393608 RepID=A0A7C9AHH2_OPUST